MTYELPRSQHGQLPFSRPPRTAPNVFEKQLSYDENSYENVICYDCNGIAFLKPRSSGKSIGSNFSDSNSLNPWNLSSVKALTVRKCSTNLEVVKSQCTCWSVLYSFLFLTIGFSMFLMILRTTGYLYLGAPEYPETTVASSTTSELPSSSNSLIPLPGNCVLGYTKFDKTGYCYKKIYHKTDFLNAQGVCESEDANLTSIHSEEENTFVADLHRDDDSIYEDKKVLSLNQEIWIGLRFVEAEQKWEWIDGTAMDYEKWAPDEPNRLDTEPYATITTSKLKGFSPEGRHWNNVREHTEQKGLICKKRPEEEE